MDRPARKPLFEPTPLVRNVGLVAFVVLTFVLACDRSLVARNLSLTNERPSDEAQLSPASAYRIGTLGHASWAANLLWIRALIYFGETLVHAQAQRHLQDFANTIEAVDPKFRAAYLWAATVSIYNSRRITRASVERSIAHLERGLREFPDDGEMLYQLGFLYWSEMLPFYRDDAERMQMRRRAAVLYQRSSARGYGPAWLSLAAGRALENAGLDQQAVEHLRALLLRTEDEASRARIRRRLEELTGESLRDPFDEEISRLDRERQGSYPYLSPMLYLFVAPPMPGLAPTHRLPGAPPTATPGATPSTTPPSG